MRNGKVIKGKPIYIYRGTQYLEMPEKVIIRKVVYDDETNKSYVYCRRLSKLVEVLSLMVILSCVVFNRFYLHKLNYEIKYNSVCYYYNGYLYLNIHNVESNSFDIQVSIFDLAEEVYTSSLSPGAYLIRIPLDNVSDSYKITFVYDTTFKTEASDVTVRVVNKEVE